MCLVPALQTIRVDPLHKSGQRRARDCDMLADLNLVSALLSPQKKPRVEHGKDSGAATCKDQVLCPHVKVTSAVAKASAETDRGVAKCLPRIDAKEKSIGDAT